MFVDMWYVVVSQSMVHLLLVCNCLQSNIQKKKKNLQSEVVAAIWNSIALNVMPTSKINLKSYSNAREVIWQSCLESRGIQIEKLYVGPGRTSELGK